MQDGNITAKSHQDRNKITVASERLAYAFVAVENAAMKRVLLLAALLCSLSWTAVSQDYDRVRSAYERGDHATALRWFRALAEQGMVEAQFYLGTMYDRGYGVPQDYAEAVKWYRKAAEQGQADAKINLGVSYEQGLGVPKDYAEAYIWFSLAAIAGDKEASKWRDKAAERLAPDQLRDAKR